MRSWRGHRIEEGLIHSLLHKVNEGGNPLHISQKQVSRIKEFKVAQDQIAIHLGLFLTSGSSCIHWESLFIESPIELALES